MSTLNQVSRRVRARDLIEERISFWTKKCQEGSTVFVDGKECDPVLKLELAEKELANSKENGDY